MKRIVGLIALLAALSTSQLCMTQAPAGAPAGTTGLCNDGTYFKGTVKLGACTGHKGLKTWWGAPKTTTTTPGKTTTPAKTTPAPAAKTTPAPAAKTTPASAAKTTPAPAAKTTPPPAAASTPAPAAKPAAPAPPSKSATATTAAAPGGGPGLVWLNTASNVYHCSGSTYYGKTKAGAYMTEDQAKAKGGHPNGGKPCSK
ncbi:MAG: signal peptide protein [Terracidiphilus sp.]